MSQPPLHPQQYDLTSKDLFKGLDAGLVRWLLGQEPRHIQWLDVSFPQIGELKADLVFQAQLEQGDCLFHLELQSTNDKDIHHRMLRYWSYISQHYQLPVYQTVLYMGAKPMNMPSGFQREVDGYNHLKYHFRLVDLSQVTPEELLALQDPAFLTLLPLSSLVQNQSPNELQSCVDLLLKYTQDTDLEKRRSLLLRTEIFSGLRFQPQMIEDIFREVEQMLIIEESAGYQRIFEKGLTKGIQKGRQEGRQEGHQEGRQEGLSEASSRFRQRIVEILRKRFGPVPVSLTERLYPLNIEQLDQALANALEVDSLQAFEDSL
jgi:predicted transposase/invertase (TIGR01784 family)